LFHRVSTTFHQRAPGRGVFAYHEAHESVPLV
jgi:hypothetical protein